MSNIISVVSLCAQLATGEVDQTKCFYAESAAPHEDNAACLVTGDKRVNSDVLIASAKEYLLQRFGYVGPMPYALYCIPADQLAGFYEYYGVSLEEEINPGDLLFAPKRDS